MKASTLFWRSINYFRGSGARAASKHTSNKGLRRLYSGAGAHLKKEIVKNLQHRILSERISIEEIVALPAELGQAALESCGLKVKDMTLQGVFNVYHPENLCKIANESDNAEILNGLAENPRLEVKGAAAKNPHTPWQTAAKIISQLPEDIKWSETSRHWISTSDWSDEWTFTIDYSKYSGAMVELAEGILASRPEDIRQRIMTEVEKKNPKIAKKIKERQEISESAAAQARTEPDAKGPLAPLYLTKDTEISGILFKGKTSVEFHPDGQISGTLAEDIQGTEFKAGMKIRLDTEGNISNL